MSRNLNPDQFIAKLNDFAAQVNARKAGKVTVTDNGDGTLSIATIGRENASGSMHIRFWERGQYVDLISTDGNEGDMTIAAMINAEPEKFTRQFKAPLLVPLYRSIAQFHGVGLKMTVG